MTTENYLEAPILTPKGTQIIGTLETINCRAETHGIHISEDASNIEPNYAGDTRVFWDSQVSVYDLDGHQVYLCDAGHEWTITRDAMGVIVVKPARMLNLEAAPDLLRVLTMYLNVDDDGDGFICAEAMDEVRQVIARATGAA